MTPGEMRGRTCLVTGANSGIGRATALGLAAHGASVVMVCRDATRGEAARSWIEREARNASVDLMVADLSSQDSIRRLVDEFRSKYDNLHALVNNAGQYVHPREATVDGLEYTFALNHLGAFLLTNLLLDTLKGSAPSRIVNVTSGAHKMGRIDFDDLMGERRYGGMKAYSQSKLANVLFTFELARRLQGIGVTVNCVHPGTVRTNFALNAKGWFAALIRGFRPFMRSPEKGAETSIYLASSPELEGVTGEYFFDKRARRASKMSYDKTLARRLWRVSAELTGLES